MAGDQSPTGHAAAELVGAMVTVETQNARSRTTLDLARPAALAITDVLTAATGNPRLRLERARDLRLMYRARTNWAMFGHYLTVDFEPLGDSATRLKFFVDPVVHRTAFDWGQGARDIRAVTDRLLRDDALRRP